MSNKLKQFGISVIIVLMVITFMPAVFFDAFTAKADTGGATIDKFSAKLVRGAQEQGGKNVWTPDGYSKGHKFVYRLSYSFSGSGKAAKGTIQMRVPKHLLKDRKGDYADEFDVGVPQGNEAVSSDDFAYKEGTGDDKDYYIIYNNKGISSGQSGTIEVAYATKYSPLKYADMAASDTFKADITIGSGTDKLTEEASADPVYIDTKVGVGSTKVVAKNASFYRSWQDSWGTKPSDAGDYNYFIWEIPTNIYEKSTQPYDFSLTCDFDSGEVVAYKFSGGDGWQNSNAIKNAQPSTTEGVVTRYDYVLTRFKKSTYDSKDSYTLHNKVAAKVTPADGADDATTVTASGEWTYTKLSYTKPALGFYADTYGLFSGPSRVSKIEKRYYYTPEYDKVSRANTEGKNATVEDAKDISDYTLSDFNEGNEDSVSGLRFFAFVRAWAYPLTLPDGKDGSDYTDYGKEKVKYEVKNNTFALQGTALGKGDYEISSLSFNLGNEIAKYDSGNLQFTVCEENVYSDTDVVSFYVQAGTDTWNKACDYNLKTGEFSNVNSLYVKSTTPQRIYFTSGVTGYKAETENAYYYAQMNTFPMVTLKSSDKVKNLTKDQTKVELKDTSTGTVYDHNGNAIYSKSRSGSDYITSAEKSSSISKIVTGTRNSKKKKEYTLTWYIDAKENYKDNEGTHQTGQSSGTFYDLAPAGSTFDLSTLEVKDGTTALSGSDYTTEIRENYKGSGRQLLIIKIKKGGYDYNFSINTIHTWEDLKEQSFKILNSVAYETGNDKIADGYKDTGGTGKDKDLLKDLDPDTDAAKFIYSQDWTTADIVTASSTGLNLKVKSGDDAEYDYETTTHPTTNYSYRIRYANNDDSASTGLVLFDSLENAENSDGTASDWHGTLKSVDTASLKQDGVEPVAYYSSVEGLNPASHHDLTEVMNGEKVWKTADEFGDISKATAVAIDCTKASSGKAFTLAKGGILSAKLHMTAPASITGKTGTAFNEAYALRSAVTDNGSTDPELLRQGVTTLKYRVIGNLTLKKISSENADTSIEGISFILQGTSDYGEEVNETRKSGNDGTLSFRNLSMGTYKLQEIGGSDDWLVDHNTRTVRIDDKGAVTVSDLTAKDGVWQFEDAPRVHGDLSLVKKSEQRDAAAQKAITDIKTAGEGATVTVDGKSYTVVSINADKLKAELKPSDGVTAGTDTPELNSLLLKTLSTGNYEVSLRDNPTYNIPDTTFHLSGTSDYGNDVSMDMTTDSTGHLTFRNIEEGTYTLRETKANADYILNTTEFKVRVDADGNASIVDGEQNGEDWVVRNEPRYHDFSIRKVDAENTSSWLSGATFHLQGVSDLGTSVDKTVTTNDAGLAEFLDVEKGTYILTETQAPAKHQLDTKRHVVTITKYGDVLCDDLSMDSDGHLQYPNKKALDGKIVITKKWVDNGKTDSNRPVPKVHLTTKDPWYEKQAYAVFDSSDGSLTFFRDNKGKYTDGQVDGTKTYYTGFENITGDQAPSWYDASKYKQKNDIKTVTFKDKIKPKTTYYWFSSAKNLTSIASLDKLDTSAVTNMESMFCWCRGLTNLDLSSFNTSAVRDMGYMFRDCSDLKTIYVSDKFVTTKVTSSSDMFVNCWSLVGGSGTKWDSSHTDAAYAHIDGGTSNPGYFTAKASSAKKMSLMSTSLENNSLLNASTVTNTAEKADAPETDGYCYAVFDSSDGSLLIKTVRGSANPYTNGQTDGTKTYYTGFAKSFSGQSSTGIASGQTAPGWLSHNSKIKTVTIQNDYSDVGIIPLTMYKWFYGMKNLTSITGLDKIDTSQVTNMAYTFCGCNNLTSLDVSNFNTSKVATTDSMFDGCYKLSKLNVGSFDTSKIINMSSMFNYCASLKSLDVSNFSLASCKYIGTMFAGCSSLTDLDLSSWDTSKVLYMQNLFSNCTKLKSLNISSFDTSAVKLRTGMFTNDNALQSIVLGEKFTKTADDTKLDGNWTRVATPSGRKVAKTSALTGANLMSTYDGTTMNGVWLIEGADESASPVDISEDYTSDDSKWVKNGDGTWTYTFDVYDDTSKFYAYEEDVTGYTSSNDEDSQLVIDGSVSKSGVITNTSTDMSSLTLKAVTSGSSPTAKDLAKKFAYTITLTGTGISGTQEFGGVIFTNGVGKVALANGESRTFTNIPSGVTYTVAQDTADSHFTSTIDKPSGTLAKGDNVITLTNAKIAADSTNSSDVAIATVLNGDDTSTSDSFTYVVELSGLEEDQDYTLSNSDGTTTTFTTDSAGNVKITFTAKAGEIKVLKNLPFGAKYRVTQSASSYTPSYTITDAGTTAGSSIQQTSDTGTSGSTLSTAFETVDKGENCTVTYTDTKMKKTSETRDMTLLIKANDSSGKATDAVVLGAWYTITGTSDDGEEINISKESGSDGKITFSDLPTGTYTLTEKQAPNGYQKDTASRKVVVDPSKSSSEDVAVENVTRNTDGSFTLYSNPVATFPVHIALKEESKSESGLKDAELAVYDSDGNRVEKWVTDGTDHISSLPAGTYTLKEVQVPDGHQASEDITFTIASDGTVTTTKTGALTSKDSTYTITMYNQVNGVGSLPLTGGMGTKLLYIAGAALIAIAIAAYLKALYEKRCRNYFQSQKKKKH